MKKLFILLAISLTVCMCAQAQIIRLLKDGNVVAVYNANEVDAVIFAPDTQSSVDAVAGVYDLQLSVSLVEMPAMGIVATMPSTVTVSASNDKINISFPSCTYVMNGAPMVLPPVEVKDIDVTVNDGKYSFDKPYSGVEEATSKAYSGTVAGSISADGAVDITATMKYGAMPFTLNMHYTNPVAE